MKKALVFDLVYGHGECLSSYIYYFEQLGYEVDVCARESVLNENPLCLLKSNHIVYSMKDKVDPFNELIKLVDMSQYELIFFSTFNHETYSVSMKLAHKFPELIVLYQEHSNIKHFLRESGNDSNIVKNSFCLGSVKEFPQVSPVYFGDVKKSEKNKDKLVLFISGLDKIHKDAYENFVKVIDGLVEEGYNILVNVCGVRGNWNTTTSKNINILGRISFEELYSYYINSDFLIVLFDEYATNFPDIQTEFLSGRTSGSRQCSIGFNIPLILQKGYQKSWGFSNSNSISFEKKNIKKAIIAAYNIKEEKYNGMVKSLIDLRKKYTDLAISNISNKMEDIHSRPEYYKITPLSIKRTVKILPDGSRKIVVEKR